MVRKSKGIRYYKVYLPRYTVGSRQAKYKLWRVNGKEDDIVIRVGNSLDRDELIRREGLQA